MYVFAIIFQSAIALGLLINITYWTVIHIQDKINDKVCRKLHEEFMKEVDEHLDKVSKEVIKSLEKRLNDPELGEIEKNRSLYLKCFLKYGIEKRNHLRS